LPLRAQRHLLTRAEVQGSGSARRLLGGRHRSSGFGHPKHAAINQLVDKTINQLDRQQEVTIALEQLDAVPGDQRLTVAGDKGYDTKRFVEGCRNRRVTPQVAQNINAQRGSMIDGRTTNHPGYVVAQKIRKRVEEIFGWMKTIGNFRKTRYRGRELTQMAGYLVGAAYNLLRIARLQAA